MTLGVTNPVLDPATWRAVVVSTQVAGTLIEVQVSLSNNILNAESFRYQIALSDHDPKATLESLVRQTIKNYKQGKDNQLILAPELELDLKEPPVIVPEPPPPPPPPTEDDIAVEKFDMLLKSIRITKVHQNLDPGLQAQYDKASKEAKLRMDNILLFALVGNGF